MAEENKQKRYVEVRSKLTSDTSPTIVGFASQFLIGKAGIDNDMSERSQILYMSMVGYNGFLKRATYIPKDNNGTRNLYKGFELYNPISRNVRHYDCANSTRVNIKKIPGTDYSACVQWVPSQDKENKRSRSTNLYNFGAVLYFPLSIVKNDLPLPNWKGEYTFDVQQTLNIIQNEAVQEYIYTYIKDNSTIPVMKEWISYLSGTTAVNISCPTAWYSDVDAEDNMFCITINVFASDIINMIRSALEQHIISINGSNERSRAFDDIGNLTDYLGKFSDQLIDKAAEKFTPVFDPAKESFTEKENNYFDYAEYHGKLKYFTAQKNVIGAVSRALDQQRSAIIVGEMGCGKTALSIGAAYLNAKNRNTNNIVICPGHLVDKWKREIERLYPNAEVVIIDNFSTLLKAEYKIRMKNRGTSLFFIISKDTAKINYLRRPAVIFDARRLTFYCPRCGKSIFIPGCTNTDIYGSISGYNSSEAAVVKYATNGIIKAFASEKRNNLFCNFGIAKRSSYPGKCDKEVRSRRYIQKYTKNESCHESLWTYSGDEDNGGWIKFPRHGWIHKDMIPLIKSSYEKADEWLKDHPEDKNEKEIRAALKDVYNAICEAEEFGYPDQKVIRRYSIAKYIREKYKGEFDYLIADEVHQYSSSNSAQSNAFGDLVRTANKTIALTGTLLNGYSDSIFPILYRMYTRDFESKGYSFESHTDFAKRYGVFQNISVSNTRNDVHRPKTTMKILPGVSPDLFTSFLLDKAVFISLSDMSDALPKYTEYPVAITMDETTRNAYKEAQESFKSYIDQNTTNKDNRSSIAFKVAQRMNAYPDQPFDIPPVIDKDGKVAVTFNNIVKTFDDRKKYVSEKDVETLRIVKEKIDKGENVLIYVNTVNTTNCIERLKDILTKQEIKTCVLTAKVAAKNREKWIDEKVKSGCRVLICNPSLVETGLDLLAFTNIIFYQVGYNLFTMRQASRRSLRLNQPNPVNVYFLYYENTTQETVLSLMANKLQAAMSIEGKFTEEGLNAMSNNDSILTQVANSLIENIEYKIETGVFNAGVGVPEQDDGSRFKLVNMLNDRVCEIDYSEFDMRKKASIKLDLRGVNLKQLIA